MVARGFSPALGGPGHAEVADRSLHFDTILSAKKATHSEPLSAYGCVGLTPHANQATRVSPLRRAHRSTACPTHHARPTFSSVSK